MAAEKPEAPKHSEAKGSDKTEEPRRDKAPEVRADRSSVTSRSGRQAPARRIIVPD